MKYKVYKNISLEAEKFEKELVEKLLDYDWHYCESAKFIIVLGGDGTLLRAIHANANEEATYFMINFGTLGYHAAMEKCDADKVVAKLVETQYVIDEYYLGILKLNSKEFIFVNDVIFNSYSFIKNSCINYGREESPINASKLAIATKFGSSGFVKYNSFSQVDLDLDFFQITCVGSINNESYKSLNRDVIIKDDKEIKGLLKNVDYINIDFNFIKNNGIIDCEIIKSNTKYYICRLEKKNV